MRIEVVVAYDRIPGICDAARGRAIAAVARAVFDIEGKAKANAPVDTGNLRDSITGEASGLEGTVATGVEYASYQEFGTSRMPAHPYMIPAATAAAPAFMSEMRAVFSG